MLRRLNDSQVSTIFGLIFLILPASNAVMALTVEKLTFEEIVRDAETIAVGVVEQAEAAYGEGKQSSRIFTTYTLSLSQVLKGDSEVARPYQLKIIGGRVGNIAHYIPGTPQFKLGRKYCLFIHEDDTYIIPLVGAYQGAYAVVQKESGIEHVEPMQGAHTITHYTQAARKPGAEKLTEHDNKMTLEDFIQRINAVLR